MLYDAYEVQRSFLAGASKLAGLGAGWLNNPSNPWGYSSMGPMVAASLEVFAHASAPRGKPEFGIHSTHIGRKDVPVLEGTKPLGVRPRGVARLDDLGGAQEAPDLVGAVWRRHAPRLFDLDGGRFRRRAASGPPGRKVARARGSRQAGAEWPSASAILSRTSAPRFAAGIPRKR